MALLFIDGFDHYTTAAQAAKKWDGVENITLTSGRNGVGAAYFGTGATAYMTKEIPGAANDMILGFALKFTIMPSVAAGRTLMYIYNTEGAIIGALQIEQDGSIALNWELFGGYTPIPGPVYSGNVLSIDTWYYIELRYKPADAGGVIQMRINGVLICDFTGDTAPHAAAVVRDIATIKFAGLFMGATIDDLYLCDTTGTINNDFLGSVSVETIYPDSDAVPNDFTATGAGTTNADRVDEATPDDDTTYVAAATVGNKERYGLAGLAVSGVTVHGVQVNNFARIDAEGSRTVKNHVYSGATEALGASKGMSTDYDYHHDLFETDPSTSAKFTEAAIGTLQVGFEIVT